MTRLPRPPGPVGSLSPPEMLGPPGGGSAPSARTPAGPFHFRPRSSARRRTARRCRHLHGPVTELRAGREVGAIGDGGAPSNGARLGFRRLVDFAAETRPDSVGCCEGGEIRRGARPGAVCDRARDHREEHPNDDCDGQHRGAKHGGRAAIASHG